MPPLARRPDWEQRLTEYLAGLSARGHRYGRHDCMLLTAGAIKAQTGKDLARGHRGKYKTAKGAAKHLKSLGFRDAAAMLDTLLPEREVAFARRGDIVLDGEGAPGVCLGSTAAFVDATEGVVGMKTRPRSEWVKAWGVG
jgi:hypothetical protein